MSDTPRTDKEAEEVMFTPTPSKPGCGFGEAVDADFARTLERELATANETIQKLRKKKSKKKSMVSAYSLAILKSIKQQAMKIKGATSVSHIYPRAYCIAKPAPLCAVFVTPCMDSEPQIRNEKYSSAHTVGNGVENVKVGDWCAIAYVTTPGCGTLYALPI